MSEEKIDDVAPRCRCSCGCEYPLLGEASKLVFRCFGCRKGVHFGGKALTRAKG